MNSLSKLIDVWYRYRYILYIFIFLSIDIDSLPTTVCFLMIAFPHCIGQLRDFFCSSILRVRKSKMAILKVQVILFMEAILHQLRLVVYPSVLQVFIHPRWLAGVLPSSVCIWTNVIATKPPPGRVTPLRWCFFSAGNPHPNASKNQV